MTVKKKIEELRGFRRPTEKESESIEKYFTCYFQRSIKICKRISSVASVMGVILMASYHSAGILGIILGLLFFAGTFWSIWQKKGLYEKIKVFRRKDYYVLDGRVCKRAMHETPGAELVRFVSDYGEEADKNFKASRKGLELGGPLLLVYVKSDQIKGGLSCVFTPYMLTEEGIRKSA